MGPLNRPKIIVLCGSSRFVDVMAVCAWLLERNENAIAMGLHLLPLWYAGGNVPDDHLAEHENVAAAMDDLHLRKIDLADEVFIVDCDNYIGQSTQREIAYARARGLALRWYTHDPIGADVETMMRDYLASIKSQGDATA